MRVAKTNLKEVRKVALENLPDLHMKKFVEDTSELSDDTHVTITIDKGEVTYAAFPPDKESVN